MSALIKANSLYNKHRQVSVLTFYFACAFGGLLKFFGFIAYLPGEMLTKENIFKLKHFRFLESNSYIVCFL